MQEIMRDDELLDEIDSEMNDEFDGETDELLDELDGELDEETELELAAELLEIETEEEFGNFFRNLARKVSSGVRTFANSQVGKSAIGALKGVARRALPAAGQMIGNAIVPGAGGMVGGTLGKLASRLFEIDMETMSPEDAELEVAKRVVRLSAKTLSNAAKTADKLRAAGKPITNNTARIIAKNAIKKAAIQTKATIAPVRVLQRTVGPEITNVIPASGRWVKRGRRIILYL